MSPACSCHAPVVSYPCHVIMSSSECYHVMSRYHVVKYHVYHVYIMYTMCHVMYLAAEKMSWFAHAISQAADSKGQLFL